MAAGVFGPLKLVVDELIECIDIHEWQGVSNSRTECTLLQKELEGGFEELRQHFSSTAPPTMTASVESLCRSIQEELAYVQGKRAEGVNGKPIDPREHLDRIVSCYQRIEGHLRRLLLNINLDMWEIVDELATDLSPSRSARYSSSRAVELKQGLSIDTRVDVLA
ncbi:Notchless protein [Ceratobasidium theobromae]|uniref:Notchless protein n=1 Tax=Ceratobasidium theobromae TaxID=1582974 RepID=A0A5N5Q940_9AGAM|nr:Notchless protein [Ceratobasidium theobromae]